MGTNLFTFVYNSIRVRVNDPENTKFWLPTRLQQLDRPGGSGKLIPLLANNWVLGDITGTSVFTFQSAIRGQWWLAIGRAHKGNPELAKHQAIACPDKPWPHLEMPQAVVYGLDNVWLLPDPPTEQTAEGYRATLTLQFGYYAGQNGMPTLSQLKLTGVYALDQCLCTAPNLGAGSPAPTACDGWVPSETIHGLGNFGITLTNVFVDADVRVHVIGAGADRQLNISIDKLTMRGPKPGTFPDLSVDTLTVETSWTWMSDNIWLPQARAALTSADGRAGLMTNLNATLNDPNTKDEIARMISGQLTGAVDGTLGTVPPGSLPTNVGQQNNDPVDQYLFDRARYSLNSPSSDYYLPRSVYGFSDPQLEPFNVDNISLGSQSFSGIEIDDLQLNGIVIQGMSNVTAPADQLSFAGSQIDATLAIATLNPGPQVTVGTNGSSRTGQVPNPPLLLTGTFTLQLMGSPLGGGFRVTVNAPNVLASTLVGGDEVSDLQVTFRGLNLQAAIAAMTIDVQIDSGFQDVVNAILNQDDVKTKILQGINDKASQELPSISQTATDNVRRLISARLDG